MRSTNDEGFKCSQLKASFLLLGFFEEIKIVHLQPHLFCPDNSQTENVSEKVFGPSEPDKNLGFLYP